MAISFTHPRPQIVDVNGSPYVGAKLYFYDPSTTTARTVYQDADLTSPHSQPVIADAAGRWPAIYLPTGAYKVRCEDSVSALIYEQDNVDPGVATGPGALPVSAGGTGATNAVAARGNLAAASSADLSTLQSTVTTHIAKITPSLIDGGTRLGELAEHDTVTAALLDDTEFGVVVRQRLSTDITGGTSHTNTIPLDNTIPQSGEGAELWSQSISPKSASSKIVVKATVVCASTVGSKIAFSFFDGGTSAVKVIPHMPFSNTFQSVPLMFELPSWGTGAKTLSIRYGASAGTTYLNSDAGGQTYGGVITSTFEVLEVQGGPF